jgi:hypothetical protein
MGEKRYAYKILVGRPGRKRQLGRSRCRWEDNTRMDLREIGCTTFIWLRIGTCFEPL